MSNSKLGKLIGKGSFTKAYLSDCGKEVFLKTCDPIKECMAYDYFPESRLFPKVEYIEQGLYKMAYLGKTSKSLKKDLRPRQYRLFKALKELFDNNWFGKGSYHSYYNKWFDLFSSLPSEFKNEKEALIEALNACANYGDDVCFEISPRNIRVSKTGSLILMDCFFLKSELRKAW